MQTIYTKVLLLKTNWTIQRTISKLRLPFKAYIPSSLYNFSAQMTTSTMGIFYIMWILGRESTCNSGKKVWEVTGNGCRINLFSFITLPKILEEGEQHKIYFYFFFPQPCRAQLALSIQDKCWRWPYLPSDWV